MFSNRWILIFCFAFMGFTTSASAVYIPHTGAVFTETTDETHTLFSDDLDEKQDEAGDIQASSFLNFPPLRFFCGNTSLFLNPRFSAQTESSALNLVSILFLRGPPVRI